MLSQPSAEIDKAKLCLYPRTISLMLAEILSRALLFPVDTVIIRLMGDEAGLTRFGYTGFFSCLRGEWTRVGPASLFAGFTGALVSELAIAWVGAELAHYLCKSTWS
ncbi:hypothetical protein FBU59_006139 [Linderina macrospora]|uniref:Uncharacterized protein n=1 Tax=Linderina macrospora TaxID=4868 RepID=A0ACC1J0S3_9FUNG|nr:hypothetical protein FBU59_006139 [Linderina macrospora]